MYKPDNTDKQILRAMQDDGRLTTKELAAKTGRSSTPVFERLKRLEREGYIKKYIAVLNAEKLNQGFVVFCNVKMLRINTDIAKDFTQVVKDMPQVTECYNISGTNDYLLKIHCPDMNYYKESILWRLGEIKYIASIESIFVMDEIKNAYGIPVQ